VVFGDLGSAYAVVSRPGIRLIRDPYSAKPYTYFCATARAGGGVVDFDAVNVLKASVS
jgi:HK97 family phage major capsid protein